MKKQIYQKKKIQIHRELCTCKCKNHPTGSIVISAYESYYSSLKRETIVYEYHCEECNEFLGKREIQQLNAGGKR